MKKMAILCFSLLLVVSMVGCSQGSGDNATKPDEQTVTQAPQDNEATPEPSEYPSVNIIAGNAAQDGDSLDSAMDFFVEEFGKETDGAVTGSVAPSSQLGGHTDMISAVQMGSMQVAEATASVLSTIAPKFAIFDIPYMAPGSAEEVYQILSGEAGEILNQDLIDNAGLRVISWMCRTPRHVYSSTHPIATLDDWKNLKIRTMQSTAMTEAMELLGAKPTAISTAERYLALQTGVVDAAENNVAEIYNCKEYEVTKYLSKTGHMCAPNVMYVSEDWFQSLTPEYQEMVLKIGEEAGRMATDTEIAMESDFESRLVSEGGMTVNTPDAAAIAEFRATLAPLYDEYKDTLGEDLINLFQGN